jgi:hypothetical protein
MASVLADRYTARAEKPVVLFLIGMRFNKLWAAHKWLPVVRAMPRMLDELGRKPEAGLLFYRYYFSRRVLMVQQYWEPFDKLLAYAHDANAEHFSAWAARAPSTAPSEKTARSGLWHET